MADIHLKDAYNDDYTVDLPDGGTVPFRDAHGHYRLAPTQGGTIPLRDAHGHLYHANIVPDAVALLVDGEKKYFLTTIATGEAVVLRDAHNHEFTANVATGGTIPHRDANNRLFYISSSLTPIGPSEPTNTYKQPDSVGDYFQPDGVSYYIQP